MAATFHTPSDAATKQSSEDGGQKGVCYIDRLPSEILACIFLYLKAHGYRYSLACLGVCKSWKKLALPTIYTSLHLHSYDIVSFVRRQRDIRKRGRPGYELIRSLTITWQKVFSGRCGCVNPSHDDRIQPHNTFCDPENHVPRVCGKDHMSETVDKEPSLYHIKPEASDVSLLSTLLC